MSDLYVMKADLWDVTIDPTGWLMSEKFDGVRAVWKHRQGKFYSSLDNPFTVPQCMINVMPKEEDCDGEFWEDYGMFQHTVGLVKRKKADPEAWYNVRFLCFDLPEVTGNFFSRITHPSLGRYASAHFCPVRQAKCLGIKSLNDFYETVLAHGGEGVILKHPNSPYEYKRSKLMLKVVPELKDEATITGYIPGEGWCKYMVGALECKWKDKTIRLGSGLTKKDRLSPPKIGEIVTFAYKQLTDSDVPRHGRFIEVRNYE